MSAPSRGTCLLVKMTSVVGTNKASTSCYDKHCTKSTSNNDTIFSNDVNLVSLSNSFEALNVENPVIKEVATVSKATTYGIHEKGQNSTFIIDKIDNLEKQILEVKLVFVDDDEKPLEKVNYSGNTSSKDEVELVDNETASYLASKGVGYSPKSLWEQ
ncbi:hypothetical protein Tco_1217024 [Tanacetum coccineum]